MNETTLPSLPGLSVRVYINHVRLNLTTWTRAGRGHVEWLRPPACHAAARVFVTALSFKLHRNKMFLIFVARSWIFSIVGSLCDREFACLASDHQGLKNVCQEGSAIRLMNRAALRFNRSIPILKQLHWLPVKFRIHFKISTITFRTIKTTSLYIWLKYLFGRIAQNIYSAQI